MKSQIEKQTINSSGVRDIGRNLGISKNTVISELKKNSSRSESVFQPQVEGIEIEIKTDADADELWNYVGRKKNQRWTWYAVERKTGVILALRGTTEDVRMKAAHFSWPNCPPFLQSVIILMIGRVTGNIFRPRNILSEKLTLGE